MNVNDLFAAIASGKYFLAVAFFVGGVVALLKQGYASQWLAKKLPPSVLPWVAVALGILGTISSAIISGQSVEQAVAAGIQSGIGAVFLHEVGIEGLRGGRELLPSRVPDAPKEAA